MIRLKIVEVGVVLGLLTLGAAASLTAAGGPGSSVQEDPPGKPAQQPTGESLVQTDIMRGVSSIQPGSTFHVGVRYEISPQWHIYWRNAGDSGLPPGISIQAPEGFVVGETLWPRPQVFRAPGEVTYGYENEVVLIVPITAPAEIAASEATFDFDLDWFVCKKLCFMGARKHTMTVPVGVHVRPTPDLVRQERAVASWLARMPVPLNKIRSARARVQADRLVVTGPAGAVQTALFYPDDTPGVSVDGPSGPVTGEVSGGRFSFEIPLKIDPENALGKPLRVAGIVVLGPDKRGRAIRVDIPVDSARDRAVDD